MTFRTIAGGFVLKPLDEELVNEQRAITKAVNDQFVQVGAVFLKTSNKSPYDSDWYQKRHLDVQLQSWIDDPELRYHNVGFNLQQGWVDVDIDANDPEFKRCVVAAMNYLQIDTRFAFGRLSAGVPSHVLVQLGEEESDNFQYLTKFEPREFRIKGERFHVQIRSFPTNLKAENLAKSAKQTVMPGSIYTHKSEEGAYDISVWWNNGKPATKVQQVAATTPRRVNFNEIVRAITFGTFLYCVQDQWTEGNRQVAAQKIGGWLARVTMDSAAMNNQEAIANDVFCPVDSEDMAERLLHFVCQYMNDDEPHMRVRVLNDAFEKLKRNPDAKIPGWPAMEQLLGGERVQALRTVFMPGSDVSNLTKMAERYIYDEADNRYIDRTRFFTSGNYVHEGAELERRHKPDVVRIGGKPREAFRVFESSDMRKHVGLRELYPSLNPGGIYRITSLGEVLSDDDSDDPTALMVFNTWRGWPVGLPDKVDPALLAKCEEYLNKILGLLTRDNPAQIEWVKKWLAWTFQRPGEKQQIAWVVIGEQGIGKSWFGNEFMKQMMGPLWGSASPKVVDTDFSVEPFINKMFTFIDEAKFHSESGVDEIKKLIRGVDVPGAEKFQSARNYRLFSRLMFASNRYDLGIGQANTRDRALFFTRAYDREYKQMNEMQFREWAETLKPWFTEYTLMMGRKEVREHYMHLFMTMPVTKEEIETIRYSSSTDAAIVLSNMTWSRRIAKHIIEDGRVFEDLDISFPFTVSDLNKRVTEVAMELGLRNVQGARVLAEFEQAGVVEKVVISGQRKLRFTHKLGSLTDIFGDAISAKLEPRFEFTEDDMGKNENDGSKREPWRGIKSGLVPRF